MRFFHCSQNSSCICPIIFRPWALRSPTKIMIIWLTEQRRPSTSAHLDLLDEMAVPKKYWNIPRKISMVQSRFNKVKGLCY